MMVAAPCPILHCGVFLIISSPASAALDSLTRACSTHEHFEVPKFRESLKEKAARKTTQLKVRARFVNALLRSYRAVLVN
jgi:hypothetical protein